MMAMLWAQEIMSAETVEDAKALYERCPRLLKERSRQFLSRAALRKSRSKEDAEDKADQELEENVKIGA